MLNLSFTACSFFIRDYRSKKKEKIHYLNEKLPVLNEFDRVIGQRTFEELLYEFFENYKGTITEKKMSKTFSIDHDKSEKGETDQFKYYCARVKSGYFGSVSEIKNITTNEVVGKRTVNDADEMTFNILIVLPKDNRKVKVQKGMMFFTNTGVFGVKAITTKHFQEFLSTKYKYSINFRGIASSLFVNKVMTRDSITRLILTKNHKSANIVESMYQGYGKETRIINDIRFTDSLWSKTKEQIHHFTQGKFNLYEFESMKYDGAKVEVMIGGKKRVINLNNLENLSIIETLPDYLRLDNGLVDEPKLTSHLIESAGEYLKDMVLSIK